MLTVIELLPTNRIDAPARIALSLSRALSSSASVLVRCVTPTAGVSSSPIRPLLPPSALPAISPVLTPLRVRLPNNPCILHTHLFRPAFLGLLLSYRNPRPLWVHTEHNLGPRRGLAATLPGRLVHRLALRRADVVVAVSRAVHDRLATHFHTQRLVVVPNGVPGPTTPPHFKSMGTPPRIGFLGRLSPEKGITELLDALALVDLPLHLFVAGDGPLAGIVQSRARSLPARHTVTFLGFVSDISHFFSRIDLLVMPSATEGLPLVLLEALAHGCPVLATKVGGVPEVMSPNMDALLLPDNRPSTIAAGLRRTLGNPGLLAEARALGRNLWQTRYDVDTMAAGYLDIFQFLTSGLPS